MESSQPTPERAGASKIRGVAHPPRTQDGAVSTPSALEWNAFPQVGEEITVGGERVRVVGRWPTAAVIELPDGRTRVIVFGPLHD